MVERRVCTFCGDEIEPGTGRMYIKKDGIVYNFCSSKCFKNLVELGRVPRRTTWTRYYAREKQVRMKGIPEEGEKPAKKEPAAEKKEEAPKAEEKKAAPKEKAKKASAKKAEPAKKPEEAKAEKPTPKQGQQEKSEKGA